MKPAPFTYHSPTTVEEVLDCLEEHQDAELMAGNQSLGIVMANRLARPDHIVDLGGVDELSFVDVADDRVEIGAMTTHRTIERSDALAEVLPMLPESAEQIAGPSVRNRGTMGGSLGEADPAGNYPAALLALEATVHLRSSAGTRSVPVSEFFIAYMFTDMREDELIESVSVDREPFPPDRTGMAFVELKRAAQTFPTVSGAAVVRVTDPDDPEPPIEHARLTLANAADVPLAVDAVADECEGEPLTDSTAAAVERAATAAAEPSEEMHADEAFKLEVAGTYGRRAIERAYDRATTD
jgi:carbon-monoxide dehydrogenase medium subunit